MKKKIIIAVSATTLVILAITGILFIKENLRLSKREAPQQATNHKLSAEPERSPVATDEETRDDAFATGKHSAAPPAKNEEKVRFHNADQKTAGGEITLGRVFTPATNGERKLEYNIAVNYQIDTIKSARAFFNQWIPRYGFMLNETASGHNNGYMTLNIRVRSSNLYAALTDLDAIGTLTSENITVHDHTENSVYQQMLGAREDIRNRRRTLAAAQTGTGAKNWEATENLLSQSEDKQLQTRMEEWRVSDRIGWATIQITLSLPVTATPAPIEVPEFRNAFVGLVNILLQIVYALIYFVPLLVIGYGFYRILSYGLKPIAKKLWPQWSVK